MSGLNSLLLIRVLQVSLHGVMVEDGVLIGMGSTLLEGVKVRHQQIRCFPTRLSLDLTSLSVHTCAPDGSHFC